MPINKPTISYQLKTVKSSKAKSTGVIYGAPNLTPSSVYTRSHLRGGALQSTKSSYDRRESLPDTDDVTQSTLRQCTRILRNVLANEGLNQGLPADKKDQSTSTNDCDRRDSIHEDDSLNSLGDPRNSFNQNCAPPLDSNRSAPPTSLCTCTTDLNNMRPNISEYKKVPGSTDPVSLCARCHNVIPSISKISTPPNIYNKDPDLGTSHDRTLPDLGFKLSSSYPGPGEFKSPGLVKYGPVLMLGDETLDGLGGLLQGKLTEVGLIARATRDADLDRLVYEMDRILQQMIRESVLLQNHLRTVAKALKGDNSALKLKLKDQSEANRDLKSELRLLRQETKQKVEELRLEIQLKGDEIRQLMEKDKTGVAYWKEKYHLLEKEHEKVKADFQAQVIQSCQKETDLIQTKHICSQTEAKLKEEILSLKLTNQNLQVELSKSQDSVRKYDQECQHNQCVIKAAREHVVQLLDRHRHQDGGCPGSGHRLMCDTPLNNGSGDWVHQATSLQQVLSMVSEGGKNPSKIYGDRARSMTMSPINFGSSNNNHNNNHLPSCSTGQSHNSESTKKYIEEGADLLKYSGEFLPGDFQRCSSDVCSTVSQQSFGSSFTKTKEDHQNEPMERSYQFPCKPRTLDRDLRGGGGGGGDDPWNPQGLKAKMSSASSVMSTVSSLRSSDDQEFRSGLQRLDSQISRLQSTLKSKLHCK